VGSFICIDGVEPSTGIVSNVEELLEHGIGNWAKC
jgi:hypothetical protein